MFNVEDLSFSVCDRLSWGLLYAGLVTIMSILMSIIATCAALFPNSDFLVIFLLIFLYGISSVSKLEPVTVGTGQQLGALTLSPPPRRSSSPSC